MGRYEVTRRQLLGGLAGAGGLGVVVGTGTASVYSDEALFGDSSLGSGTIDLAVSRDPDAASGSASGALPVTVEVSPTEPTETVDLYLSLPNEGGNNPAVPWVRSMCPEKRGADSIPDLTFRYADCSGDCAAAESFDDLASGVRLDANAEPGLPHEERACLEPGESLHLALDVGYDDFEKAASTSFRLEFVGVQCRNSDAYDPFSGGTDCKESDSDPKHPSGTSDKGESHDGFWGRLGK